MASAGMDATVTDADFLLGYLNPEYFAGGEVRVDLAAAHAAVERLAERVASVRSEAAWGIHEVVDETMASAARVHVAERGRDPRDYALLATGGAGPVHAWSVAKKLGLARVICPPSAGVASALGLLVAPARVDRMATVGVRLDQGEIGALEAAFQRLEDEARAVIADTGLKLEAATVRRLADGRFFGQGFDLVVALPDGPYADDEATRRAPRGGLRGRLPREVRPHAAQRARGVHQHPRGDACAGRRQRRDRPRRGGAASPAARSRGGGRAYFPEAGGFVDTAVYDRYRLRRRRGARGPRGRGGRRLDARRRPRRRRGRRPER